MSINVPGCEFIYHLSHHLFSVMDLFPLGAFSGVLLFKFSTSMDMGTFLKY